MGSWQIKEIAMKTCLYCKGELEEQLVTRVQEYQGKWYVLENLPALVCKQCGEKFYRPEIHDHVIQLITSNEPPIRTEFIAVYDAAINR